MKKQDKNQERRTRDLKRKIRKALNNIDGCTNEGMFTLKFVYGAVEGYAPKEGGAA